MDSQAVTEAARLCARGELLESDLSKKLRLANVRPLRFLGVGTATGADPDRVARVRITAAGVH